MLVFKLTSAGLNAALNAQNLGLKLELATIKLGSGQYNVVENDPRTAMVSPFLTALFAGGGVEPDSHTLRFNSSFKDNQSRPVYEIGIFTRDGVLFAITSTTGEPYFLTSKTLTTVVASGLKLGAFNSSTVQLVLDQNGAMALHIIGMHEAHTDPHPQYVKEGDFSDLSGLIENLFVRKTQIVNNLNSTSATDVLSAKMGNDLARSAAFRVFFGQTSGSIVNSDNTNTYIRLLNGDLVPMGGSTRVYGTGNVVVNTLNGELKIQGTMNDTLVSYSTVEALTANQGRILNEKIDAVAYNVSNIIINNQQVLQDQLNNKYDKSGGNITGLAIAEQGIITKSFELRGVSVSNKTGMTITSSLEYTNFSMQNSIGTIVTNGLFNFQGRINATNLFLSNLLGNSGDYTSQRSLNTVYTNTKPCAIWVNIASNQTKGSTALDAYTSSFGGTFLGTKIATVKINSNVTDGGCNISFPVRPGEQYKVTGTGFSHWAEIW